MLELLLQTLGATSLKILNSDDVPMQATHKIILTSKKLNNLELSLFLRSVSSIK